MIWINFTPQVGREQAGRRPAIVISPILFVKHRLKLLLKSSVY
ncbi:MAG: type II toxin-antitoxin system PemK/MazF family toxin [Sphaerospermopsis kisseleviana]